MNFHTRFLVLIFLIISVPAKSQISTDQMKLNGLHKRTQARLNQLHNLSLSYAFRMSAMGERVEREYYQHKLDSLDRLIETTNGDGLAIDLKFAKTHPNSEVALNALFYRLQRSEGSGYYQEIYILFNSLNPALKNSNQGIEMKAALANFKNSSIEQLAPGFSVKDVNHQDLTLSSYRAKKYVLLDFWASWCAPCRNDFSVMRDIYETYHPKDLEIISISKDLNAEQWKGAIEADSIGLWRHFPIKQNNSNVDKLYFVIAIPVKILINKDGVIVGRWRGGGEENIAALKKCLRERLPE